MTQAKLPTRQELAETAADDLVHVVDVSDTTDDPTGSSRKVRLSNLLTFALAALQSTVRLFTRQQNFGAVELTDAATITWDLDLAQAAEVTLAGNRTLADPTHLVNGGTYSLLVRQDATGGRTLQYGPAYKWPGGQAPTLTAAANARDLLVFYCDGTAMLGALTADLR